MKVAIVFFSATNNTKTMATVIKKELEEMGASAKMHDITPASARQHHMSFSAYDAVVFGFPVHSLRAPRVVREWLQGLDGEGKKCSMFFTYGGFMVHPSHHSTRQILNRQGFVVVSSAEFPGAHTFNIGGWCAFPERPNDQEFDQARQYVIATYRRFSGEDENIVGELDRGTFDEEKLDQFESFRFKVISQFPTRYGEGCSMCRLCENACPTGAMNHETGEAKGDRCIACLRCVVLCPDQVLKINSTRESWESKLTMSRTSEAELNEQVGKIYL